MRLGYNTNGLANHSLPTAIRLLAAVGYRSVAITIDHYALNPYAERHEAEVDQIGNLLAEHGMRSVIETGARYLLDPWHKHEPTLVSPKEAGRPRRIEFLRHAIDVAARLGSDCVSLWSGAVRRDDRPEDAMRRLVEGLQQIVDYAERREVTLGFEPEPGMLIDTMDRYAELLQQVDSPRLQLTLDIGHVHCQNEGPIDAMIRRWANRLINVHIEDMRRGVHEHLMFGEGEIDFPPVIAALAESGYQGGLHVELSRHSHVGPAAAQHAYAFLDSLISKET